MSNNDDDSVPKGIITQVKRDGSYAQPPPAEEEEEQVDSSDEEQGGGFLRSLCCCCFPSKKTNHGGNTSLNVVVEQTPPDQGGGPFLLGPAKPEFVGKKTLVLDLDETLVHSSFKAVSSYDFTVSVEIEDTVHKVYVLKRPHVDQFLEAMGKIYEVVIFTASLSKYADPVLDLLDIHKVVQWRLFRESCTTFKGNYVKDLARIGRDLSSAVIIDNSPSSYVFSQENAIPVESWFDDPNDTELLELIPFLEKMNKADNVRTFLAQARKNGKFTI